MIRMRENRAADLLVHTAPRENRLTLLRMLVERGVNFPIEIVEKRGDRPLMFVPSELLRIRRHTRLHRQCVLPQSVRLGVFAKQIPGLFSIEHEIHNIVVAGGGVLLWWRGQAVSAGNWPFRVMWRKRSEGVKESPANGQGQVAPPTPPLKLHTCRECRGRLPSPVLHSAERLV